MPTFLFFFPFQKSVYMLFAASMRVCVHVILQNCLSRLYITSTYHLTKPYPTNYKLCVCVFVNYPVYSNTLISNKYIHISYSFHVRYFPFVYCVLFYFPWCTWKFQLNVHINIYTHTHQNTLYYE